MMEVLKGKTIKDASMIKDNNKRKLEIEFECGESITINPMRYDIKMLDEFNDLSELFITIDIPSEWFENR